MLQLNLYWEDNLLRLDESSWTNEEIKAINECLAKDQTTMSVRVEAFEQKFSDYVGSKFSIMVNSGSSANLLAAYALKLKFPITKNKYKVIVPSLSWSTTYFPWIQFGYNLKFVDINLNNFNINVDAVKEALEDNVAGICVPHILGSGADIKELLRLAREKNLWIMEDTCESLGNKPDFSENKLLGTLSNIGTFSFFRSHHISTMEGGMIVTDDEELATYAKSLRTHGWGRNLLPNKYLGIGSKNSWKSKFEFFLPGFNLRPLEISGAVGLIQLQKLEVFLKHRRQNAHMLKEYLKDFDFLALQEQELNGSWMAFAFRCKGNIRDKVVEALESNGVETRPVITGNFINQPVMQRIQGKFEIFGELKNSQQIEDHGFMIANHGRNLELELEKISNIFKSI
jgi:CDP-6-deoxy-D-xylo-4-hexulose-3-dehydrase